jgi:hypothetical protein
MSQEARVSTYEHYTTPVPPGTWDVPAAGAIAERMEAEQAAEFADQAEEVDKAIAEGAAG